MTLTLNKNDTWEGYGNKTASLEPIAIAAGWGRHSGRERNASNSSSTHGTKPSAKGKQLRLTYPHLGVAGVHADGVLLAGRCGSHTHVRFRSRSRHIVAGRVTYAGRSWTRRPGVVLARVGHLRPRVYRERFCRVRASLHVRNENMTVVLVLGSVVLVLVLVSPAKSKS